MLAGSTMSSILLMSSHVEWAATKKLSQVTLNQNLLLQPPYLSVRGRAVPCSLCDALTRRIKIRLRRQVRPCLLRRHVFGVPIGPVLVAMAKTLLVRAVGRLGAPHCARQVAC